MIEGLRLLPWLQEATRRNPDAVGHLGNCATCKKRLSPANRRAIGCGWEPLDAHATPWRPVGWPSDPPTTCVGYTINLPEVAETIEARFYLKNGSLSVLVKDELTDSLRTCIHILEHADAEAAAWASKNPVK